MRKVNSRALLHSCRPILAESQHIRPQALKFRVQDHLALNPCLRHCGGATPHANSG